jgi:hypothetical protein
MAGPQDIQRYPRGLIGLLGMQATGDTPHTLAQQTAAVLDITDFYLNDRLEVLSVALAAAPAALGNFQFVGSAVPSGEMWMVTDVAVNCGGTVAAAASITFAPVIFRNQALPGNGVVAGPTTTAATGQNQLSGQHYERPNLVLPGQSFGIQVQAITGAPGVAFQLTAWFARLRV